MSGSELRVGVLGQPKDVKVKAVSTRQALLLMAFALAVIFALACDARCYQGFDLWGRPLYPEIHEPPRNELSADRAGQDSP